MNHATTQHTGLAVRASDAEREQTVTVLQRSFVEGRLKQAEFEERVDAAYAAQVRAQLHALTTDLAAAQEQHPRSGIVLDPCLLGFLLCVFPPAGIAYWLLSRRKQPTTADAGIS